MFITSVTDYDNLNDDYNNGISIKNNCKNKENNIDIIIPTLLLTIPGGLSILFSISLMVYALIKLLFKII